MRIVMRDKLELHKPKDGLGDRLVHHLKVINPAWRAVRQFSPSGGKYTPIPKFLYATEQVGDTYYFPRAIEVPAEWVTPELRQVAVEDQRTLSKVAFPEERITPNLMQAELLRKFRKQLKHDAEAGYLIQAGTSFGKTIAMLLMAKAAGQQTLILTHRTLIYDVWKAEIHKTFGGNADTGFIRRSECDIGKHFTIAMLQTLHRWPEAELLKLLQQFGTVILDEAHICPMPYIRSIVGICPAMYRIGGTATPKREDGMEKFLYWHFGQPFYTATSTSMVADNQLSINSVSLVTTKFEYTPEDEGVFDAHAMTEKLSKSKRRNKLIVRHVVADLEHPANYVLVTTSRRNHAKILAKRLRKHNPILLIGDREQGIVQFNRDVEELQKGTRRLVVATEQLIREGTNIPPLNRLHVAMPMRHKGNSTQLFGRICRASKHTDKKDAKVTIYFDIRVPALRNRVMRMVQVLRKLGVPNIKDVWIV